jgi:hypothetical protein
MQLDCGDPHAIVNLPARGLWYIPHTTCYLLPENLEMTIVTRIRFLLLCIATATWTCVGIAYPQATLNPVAGIANSEEKPRPDRLHEAALIDSTPQTPVDVFMHVIESIRMGDRRRILEEAVPYVTTDSKEWLEKLTDETAAEAKDWAKDIQVRDGKIFGDLAVIVKYNFILRTRIDRPIGWEEVDLDTDPFFLHRVDGEWKVLLSEMEDLHSYISKHRLNPQLSEAMAWYQANKRTIRTTLQGDKEKEVALLKSRHKPSVKTGTLTETFIHEKAGAEYLWLVIDAKDGQHLTDAVYLYARKAIELAEKSNLKGSPLIEEKESSPHRGNIVFFIRNPSEPKKGYYRAFAIDDLKRIQGLSFYEYDKIHSRRGLWDIKETLPDRILVNKWKDSQITIPCTEASGGAFLPLGTSLADAR